MRIFQKLTACICALALLLGIIPVSVCSAEKGDSCLPCVKGGAEGEAEAEAEGLLCNESIIKILYL